ncbi:metal ABC transporter solute-binding protein, Zn/Mn family [Marinobacter halotolerans]|uniref:metal ABC transporter solute-binding protein, Zn/Mn family n=1 Tax=Marinobacter halotolerans TaxID=1569211 RepID=UPI00124482B2|nr:zinc ABC transporter substrate-binding protein [Marinobacter halotolerans]
MIRQLFHRLALRVLALALIILPLSLSANTQVVVSLKPLELLVRAIATPDTTVTTLVGPGDNPHNYSMKPSQRRALQDAEAIFWVGPDMETFLGRMLNGDDFRSRAHALGDGEAEEDHGDAHGHHHHGHDEDSDPHIWLDPALALEMARDIHSVLKSLNTSDDATLDANLARFEKALARTESEIRSQLEPASAISLFTYHNAFTHFAQHYDLTLAGVLNPGSEVSAGARHLANLQKQLESADRPCLLTERTANKESWRPIIGDLKVTFSDWDPLATDIKADQDGYLAFQQSLANAVAKCL